MDVNFSWIYFQLIVCPPVYSLNHKAYVQQLESSRLKLTQLEQELQKARQQVLSLSFAISSSLLHSACFFHIHCRLCNQSEMFLSFGREFLFLTQEINPMLRVEMVVSLSWFLIWCWSLESLAFLEHKNISLLSSITALLIYASGTFY